VGRFAARQSLIGPTIALLPLSGDRPTLPAEEECSMFELLIGYRYRSVVIVDGVAGEPPVGPDTVQLVGHCDEFPANPENELRQALPAILGRRFADAKAPDTPGARGLLCLLAGKGDHSGMFLWRPRRAGA